MNDFYGQKPTSFDPMSGSITLSSMPIIIPSTDTPINDVVTSDTDHDKSIDNVPSSSSSPQASSSSSSSLPSSSSSSSLEAIERGPTFQFCIRDSATARQDLEMAMESMQNKLSIYKISDIDDVSDKTTDIYPDSTVDIANDVTDATTSSSISTTAVSSPISKPPLALFMLGSIERGNKLP